MLPFSRLPQRGNGVKGQYVYALIMPQPIPKVLARTSVKQPSDFDRTAFREMVVKCLVEVEVEVIGSACFREPHANGDPHLNLLVRGGERWKWKKAAVPFDTAPAAIAVATLAAHRQALC